MNDIYFFNPTCDFAIANGSPNWQPNQLLQKMEEDLDLLPAYLANSSDGILLYNYPSDSFLDDFQKIEFTFPCFIQKKNLNQIPQNQIGNIKPWGWSPAAHKQTEYLKNLCSDEFIASPVFNWNPEIKHFYSRSFSASVLADVLKNLKTENILPLNYLPKVCKTETDVENALNCWGKIMLKAPWSSSGRGLQPITKTPVHQKVWEKINGIIYDQGFVLAEPLLNKVHDLAFLFEIKKGIISFTGTSHFFTDKNGKYEGNFLNVVSKPDFDNVDSFTNGMQVIILPELIRVLQNSKLPAVYEGPFGVDMLIYRDSNNELFINPCLEINLRFTMGFVALKIEKLLAEKSKGVFRIFYEPGKSFLSFSNEMRTKHPLIITKSKIESGFLALTEPTPDKKFGAYLLAEPM
jgi:hypothetical protein